MTGSSLFYKLLTAMVVLAMGLVALPASPAYAATITVNTTADEVANNASCSLREAIIAANANASFNGCNYTGSGPDDTITLASGSTYTLSIPGSADGTQGDLDVGNVAGTSGNLTIQASGATNAIIDAADISRVFEVSAAGNPSLTLIGITVTNGTDPDGAGIFFDGTGTLTVMKSTVSNNVATGGGNCGAGIYNDTAATVVITDSTISGNSCAAAGADGAGLYKGTDGTLTITNSTFANNEAADTGGGAHLSMETGTATITNSTFFGNVAGSRGGGLLVNSGTVNVEFSTFSDNEGNDPLSSSRGGAVQATGTGVVSVLRSILANSVGPDCDEFGASATVNITNSLVENIGDCGGTATSSADPGLAALANKGGFTPTMSITNSSPAFNAALSCGSTTTDQRGVARPQGEACDLGAFELEVGVVDPAPTVVSVVRADPSPTDAASVDFTVTFSEDVTGVDAADFALTTTGVSGASIAGVTGSGAVYNVAVNTGSGSGTIRLDVLDNDSILDSGDNPLAGGFTSGEVYTIDRGAIFEDVPETYWAFSFVERLYNAGITGGCATNPLRYCPDNTVTRAEMAVFLLRGIHGSNYAPPAVGASTGFNDVPTTYWAAAWIKQLAAEGITTGCGNGNYCPDAPVTRAEMAVFLVRTFGLP